VGATDELGRSGGSAGCENRWALSVPSGTMGVDLAPTGRKQDMTPTTEPIEERTR